MDVKCHVYYIFVTIVSIILSNYHVKAAQFKMCQDDLKKIQCGIGQRIRIKTIKQTAMNYPRLVKVKKNCIQDFTFIRNKCNGQQSCILNGTYLSSGACKVYPRDVSVTYTCEYFNGHNYIYYNKLYGVRLSLEGMSCIGNYLISDFNYDAAVYNRCDKPWADISSCLSRHIRNRCKRRRQCITESQISWCFASPYYFDVSYRCFEDNANITGNNNDQSPTFNRDIESTVIKGSGGSPDLPDLNGTQTFPNVSGVSPPFNISDTTVPDVKDGIILASCCGVVLIVMIVISTFCFVRHKRKSKKTNKRGSGDTRLNSLSDVGTSNTGQHSNADMATQDGEYSEMSALQNEASSSTTQRQENSYFILDPNARCSKTQTPLHGNNTIASGSRIHSSTEKNEHSTADLSNQDGDYSEISPLQNDKTTHQPENSYFILDPNAKCLKTELLTNTVTPDQHNEEDHYAMASEGVYDVSNNTRHKESDTIYCHAIDDVYDMSASFRKKLSDDNDTY